MVAVRHLKLPDTIPNRRADPLSGFRFSRRKNMNPLLLIIGIPVGLYILWFVFEFIRYLASGEYAVDKRLRKVTR